MNKNASYYRTLFAISENDLSLYRSLTNQVRSQKTTFYEKFYEWMRTHPLFADIFADGVIDGVKESEEQMWTDIIDFPLDDAYVEQQYSFGEMFANEGMPYHAYYACIVAYQEKLYELLEQNSLMTPELSFVFRKTLNVEAMIVSDSYRTTTAKQVQEQKDALSEMSTPITKLWDGILLLPLVGFIDSKRAQDIMGTMLNAISETQARVFILDISGIGVMDTAVANYLIQITKSTRLMGCLCLISGISGSVAQTIVELGIQIEDVTTAGTMKDALNKALGYTGAKVIKIKAI